MQPGKPDLDGISAESGGGTALARRCAAISRRLPRQNIISSAWTDLCAIDLPEFPLRNGYVSHATGAAIGSSPTQRISNIHQLREHGAPRTVTVSAVLRARSMELWLPSQTFPTQCSSRPMAGTAAGSTRVSGASKSNSWTALCARWAVPGACRRARGGGAARAGRSDGRAAARRRSTRPAAPAACNDTCTSICEHHPSPITVTSHNTQSSHLLRCCARAA